MGGMVNNTQNEEEGAGLRKIYVLADIWETYNELLFENYLLIHIKIKV